MTATTRKRSASHAAHTSMSASPTRAMKACATLQSQRVGHRQLLQLPPGGADAAVAKQLLDGQQVNVVFEHAHGPGTMPFEDAARKCLQ